MSDKIIVKCPVCNHVVSDFDECISDPCEHAVLIYVDILGGEFVHEGDEELAGLLTARYEHYYESDEAEDRTLDEVMYEYIEENGGYEIVETTTSGLACGPTSSTEYVMFKTA